MMHRIQGWRVAALWAAALAILLALAACAGRGETPAVVESETIASVDAEHADTDTDFDDALPALDALGLGEGELVRVAATTNIVADIVAQVGGDRIELTALMPSGADPHSYTPTPQDLRHLNEAHVIFVNGLGLEEALLPILTNLDREVPIVSVNVCVDTVAFGGEHHMHDDDDHDGEHQATHEHERSELSPRLLAIAGYDGVVNLLSLDSFEVVDSYALAGSARVYPVFDDRYIFAVQTDDNYVNIIHSGVEEIGHDDHIHTVLGTPALAPLGFEAATPIHFAAHSDQVAIFNDGDGTAVLVTRGEVINENTELVVLDAGRPHHGSAVPMHDAVLLSIPDPDSDAALPIGVRVVTPDGEEIARFEECPGLHGEAAVGHRVVFGCSDGLLVLHEHEGEFEAAKIPNPTGEGRTGSFASHPHVTRLLGNYTPFGIVVIDLIALTSELLEMPIEIRNFYFHPEHTDEAVVLTVDGALHIIDLDSGNIENSVEVVDSFAEAYRDSENQDPLPYLQVAADFAFVANQAGDIVIIDLDDLDVLEILSLDAPVLSMAAFGRAEAADAFDHRDDREDAPAHEDEHGDAQGHDHADDHHHHDGDDPHTWQSVRNVMVWVTNIEHALSALAPDHAAVYAANAQDYRDELDTLDAEIRALVAEIPVDNRKLVTDHATFSYFARDYEFEVLGAVIPSFSTIAAPSAQELAALQDQMQDANVRAIFAGTTVNPALAERLAEDLSIQLVSLYSDSLSEPDGPAANYLDFMRYNVAAMVDALR